MRGQFRRPRRPGPKMHLLPTTKRAISFEILPISQIRDNPHNAREHDRKQNTKLAQSIRKFGFNVPPLVDESGELLCGHARVAAARQVGLTEIPVIRAAHLTEPEKRAFIIADNRLAELGKWNKEALAREIRFLSELNVDFDFSAIGYDTADVDYLLETVDEVPGREEALPKVAESPPVTRPGDLWLLGDHRVYCGNALDSASYEALLGNERAQMVFTDPPYNVPIDGHVGGLGTVKHREFAMASGEMTDEQFTDFLSGTVHRIKSFADDGAICFLCMDWRHAEHLLKAARPLTLKTICVWVKNNAGMGSLYRSQHEFVFVYKCGSANHINNVELGKHGRYRTNVWEYRGFNSFSPERDELLRSHPTLRAC
jgi:hypothetical protein